MTSKAAMQSAVSQWEVIRKIQEKARDVLSPDECSTLRERTQEGAHRALVLLDAALETRRKRTPTPPPSLEEEPTETRHIREILTCTTAEGAPCRHVSSCYGAPTEDP